MRRQASLLLCVVTGVCRAQCDPQRIAVAETFDFQPVAMTVFEGELVMGGQFTRVGGAAIPRIARWDGATWRGVGSGFSSPVQGLAVHRGELIAGGYFPGRISAWDGVQWRTIGGGVSAPTTSSAVYTVMSWGGDLVCGGLFDRAGDVPASRIAAWDGNSWRAMGEGFDRSVWALAVYSGELIAAGRFTASGTTPLNCIARWDGAAWKPLGPGLEGDVLALAVYGNELFAAGTFQSSAGRPMHCIARWDGADWRPLAEGLLARPGYEFTSYVSGLCVYRGDLYAAGVFDRSGEVYMDGLARWDGSAWHALTGSDRNARAVAVYGHELIATESVSSSGGEGWSRWSCPPCIADVDDDGLIDFTDYLSFLDLYRSDDPAADVNGDGVIDRADWLLFLDVYASGCA